jgi:2-succinyl-6-hydroxy-2,4-cyclohexadiene-1-carboxylate synthase
VEVRRVFVHGFTQTPTSWELVTKHLPGDVQLAALTTTPDFVSAAAALAVGSAEYVGYSMGGRLCLQLALDRPDVVERLVLVSASPGIADPALRAARRDADELLAQSIERDGVRAFLERWMAQPLFASLPRERSGMDDRIRHNTVASLTYQLRVLGQGSQPSNWERLRELKMPVLLIAGELDLTYVALAHEMGQAIANARVVVIAAAGHACQLEQPEDVAHLLTSW